MRKIIIPIFALCLAPCALSAATYYQGGSANASGQYNYATGGAAPGTKMATTNARPNTYYTPQKSYYTPGAVRPTNGYSAYNNGVATLSQGRQNAGPAQANATTSGRAHRGLSANVNASYESAVWNFDMKSAGSTLHYDNIAWATFDLGAAYTFDVGSQGTGLRIDAGLKLGSQLSDSTMVDDDISKGGYNSNFYYDDVNENGGYDSGDNVIGNIYSKAISIGKSSGGSLIGYNFGLGLTDMFKIGNLRITPSVGWRSLSYTLKTTNNHGVSIQTGYCYPGSGDETQCDPFLVVNNPGGGQTVIWEDPNVTGGAIDSGDTFSYDQPGTSHKYTVDWNGPYIALDLDYDINQYNAINGRVEFGLPGYDSKGNQPYRPDWAHPTSVEDKTGIGGAYHIGFLAQWATAITDSVSFTVGLTYDYYNVNGADAKTNLNGGYYNDLYNALINATDAGGEYILLGNTPEDREEFALGDNILSGPQQAIADQMNGIIDLANTCDNWSCKVNKEVNSFYRSVGIRVGLSARF